MRELNLLVIDDDDLAIQTVKMAAPREWLVRGGFSLETAIPKGEPIHAAMVDIHLTSDMGRREGLKIIKDLRALNPHLDIIAISGDIHRELMEDCLRAGANLFLPKPLSIEELQLILGKIEQYWLLQGARSRTQKSPQAWMGSSATAREVQRQIAGVKGELGPILIEGETGTGKELVAQWIHWQDEGRPMVSINMSTLPENLFESELFGHVRGSFTGADQNKMGLAEAAHGGDLFLDEIEALPMSCQAKLLRFLESGEIRRVGGKETIHVQCRVIAATNQSLESLVKSGQFREDLLWRLSGHKIQLPPLRERVEDIPELAQHFLNQSSSVRKKTLESDAASALMAYTWPGNVRELKRICEQLLLTAPLPVIRRQDVISLINPPRENISSEHLPLEIGLHAMTVNFEKAVLKQALERYPHIEECARVLKLSRSSLYKKLKDHELRGEGHE